MILIFLLFTFNFIATQTKAEDDNSISKAYIKAYEQMSENSKSKNKNDTYLEAQNELSKNFKEITKKNQEKMIKEIFQNHQDLIEDLTELELKGKVIVSPEKRQKLKQKYSKNLKEQKIESQSNKEKISKKEDNKKTNSKGKNFFQNTQERIHSTGEVDPSLENKVEILQFDKKSN
jgi:hypothetical protein